MYKIGWASSAITPSKPAWLCGYAARSKPSQGVHDPIFAKVCYLSDGECEAALVSWDLIAATGEQAEAVRQEAARLCGVDNVIVGATHTHSAPINCNQLKWEPGELDEEWVVGVVQLSARLVAEAKRKAAPAKLLSGRAQVPEVAKNRRSGEHVVDDLLTALWARNDQGEIGGFVVNYPCHCTVLDASNYEISADYPGCLYRGLEERFPGTTPLFFNGACGDINIGYSADASALGVDMGTLRSYATAEKMAGYLLGGVEKAMAQAEELETRLRFHRVPLALPVREDLPARQELVRELAQLSESAQPDDAAKTRQVYLTSLLSNIDGYCSGKTVIEAEAALLEIGQLLLVTVPGELFCEIALRLREQFPRRDLMILGYSNGYLGYLPTRRACQKGGYECETSVHGPQTEEYLLETLSAAIRSL